MADLINNESSSSRTAPARALPQEERPLRAPAGAGHLARRPSRTRSGQRPECNRLAIVRNLDDNPSGIYHQNHAQEASNLINSNQTLVEYPRLASFFDSDDNVMLYRRFGFLHARLLLQKQHELREMEEALDNLDQEGSIGMHQMARGEPQNRRVMLGMLEQKFAGYSDFILQAHNFRADTNWRSANPQSVRRWLYQGPNIRKLDQESHPRWQLYTAKVKSAVLDPQDNDWLHYNIEDILDVGGHDVGYYVSHAGSSRGRRSRGSIDRDRRPTESRLTEAAERRNASTLPLSWSSRAGHVFQCLFNALFLPVSVLIYSVNISSALGYLMLVNTLNSQQNGLSDIYWKASLTAWVVTITFLLVHGLFFGKYTTECYARRLVLTSIVFCGAIAFALHALAANVISGVLVGFTLSVAFLQIW